MINHLALIMDGNRRWATLNSFAVWRGHQEGAKGVEMAIKYCLERGIPYLSLYTFSLENFNRSGEEKNQLFELVVDGITKRAQEFIARGISVRFVGDRSQFPVVVIPAVEQVEQATASLTTLVLNILFCYGGRQEIVTATKKLVTKVQENILTVDAITQETFKQELWTGNIPDPEIIVRTGGFKRLSNFLLYQAAYSDFFFLDVLWPDLTEQHLDKVLTEFKQCKRNFGA